MALDSGAPSLRSPQPPRRTSPRLARGGGGGSVPRLAALHRRAPVAVVATAAAAAALGRDGAQRRCRRARRNARQTVARVDVLNNGRRLVFREITISAPSLFF